MERIARFKQYEYRQNSNLVLMADRSSIRRDPNEAKGEVESLVGRLGGKMGDRVSRDRPKDLDEKLEKMRLRAKQNKDREKDIIKKHQQEDRDNVLSAKIDESVYKPKTRETKVAYERLLTSIQSAIGDQSSSMLFSFADEILAILKNDVLTDSVKRQEVFNLLGSRNDDIYTDILRTSSRITDYVEHLTHDDDSARDENADDSADVAVNFPGEDDEDDETYQFVVRDESDEDDDNSDSETKRSSSSSSSSRASSRRRVDDDEDYDPLLTGGANKRQAAGRKQKDIKTRKEEEEEEEDDDDDEEGDTDMKKKKQSVIKSMDLGDGAGSDADSDSDEATRLDPRSVDSFWLQRQISKFEKDPLTAQNLTKEVFQILESTLDDSHFCENSLVGLLGTDQFNFIKLLLQNQTTIVFCTRLAKAQNEQERRKVEAEMTSGEARRILDAIGGASGPDGKHRQKASKAEQLKAKAEAMEKADEISSVGRSLSSRHKRKVLDLESLTFGQGAHFMSNNECRLPKESKRYFHKNYEELHIPMVKQPDFSKDEKLVSITALPSWARPAFSANVKHLNRVQSRIFPAAFLGTENVLLCAPTGAGKTNVAKLCMLHEIGLHRDTSVPQDAPFEQQRFDLEELKIVYISPMKSLVREQVGTFTEALEPFGIKVRELSGDINLTKQQISETHVIITTPEKWDIVTRKSGDRTFTQFVRLVIFDEIHLLHDDRGPVIENIVARTIRQIEETQEMVRIVGLSATLPNYEDVATFLRVRPDNLFAFDNSYRPVPLEQQYIGITERSAMKRFKLMNDILYEKVLERAGRFQMIVFVHSRKETALTAKMLVERAQDAGELPKFFQNDSVTRTILAEIAQSPELKNNDLKTLLPYGFAIHHAGMTRYDKNVVEDLFRDQRIQVLVSTATLAWGVNLPAHTVIIKGTQMYNPEKGAWVELSPMDIMQMLGRAGRIDYDVSGEGIVLTHQQEIQYYASLMNNQLPIESQLISRLSDSLNAEIVMGSIHNMEEAVQWLGYTYLYICMLRSPTLYAISIDEYDEDKLLERRRTDLIHSAAVVLDKANLIKYDRRTGDFQVTNLGRVASHYYLSHSSITIYNEHLKPTMSDIDLFRLFSLSSEFKYLTVRQEEKLELEKLLDRVPIPVKEGVEESAAKVNVLLQAYVSRLKLDGFALIADMVYVTQSAGRIMRALFEIVLKRGWAPLAHKTLTLAKMISQRQWSSQTPLRQFPDVLPIILKRLESGDLPFDRLYDLNSQELGQLINHKPMGKTLFTKIHQFPRFELSTSIHPITRSLLRVTLAIMPDFEWNESVHGTAEGFWVFVEDVNGETILHHEYFILKSKYAQEEHTLNFTVPIYEPLPPQYYVRIVSDRWLGSETILPISFRSLILPEKYAPHTELLDLQRTPLSALRNAKFEALYAKKNLSVLNPIQTQVFHTFYESNDNAMLSAPNGSGRLFCAELAILHLFNVHKNHSDVSSQQKQQQQQLRHNQQQQQQQQQQIEAINNTNGKTVYLVPVKTMAQSRLLEWKDRFEPLGKVVSLLTGETTVDLKLLERSDIVIATPADWDMLSRRWKIRKNVQAVSLFIMDELHMIGSEAGALYEFVVSRQRYIARNTESATRFVGFSTAISNARDVGLWIGATTKNTFNFHPNSRPVPLEIHLKGFDEAHFEYRMLAMSKPARLAIQHHAVDKPVIVFAPSRQQILRFATDLQIFCEGSENPQRFLHCDPEELMPFISPIQNKALQKLLLFGIGIYHEYMTLTEKAIVEEAFAVGAIQVLIASRESCWSLSTPAHVVIIMGTQYYDGREHTYQDYPVTDILQMTDFASKSYDSSSAASGVTAHRGSSSSKCVILCHGPKKDYYKKFLFEPLPVESHLDYALADHLNSEIVATTIENVQNAIKVLTWTFFYRRLRLNPNFYNLAGVTDEHLRDHLSQLVENALQELSESQCIAIEGNDNNPDVSALNLGMIASYYNIRHTTIDLFGKSITENSKIAGLLEILTSAEEFEQLPIRNGEPSLLSRMAAHLPIKINSTKFNDPHIKANILLQSHFCRNRLPSLELVKDQEMVLELTPKFLRAMVDVISSHGWLRPALAVMDLSQMVVQAVKYRESPLKQLPFFTDEIIDRCKRAKVEKIYDILEMEDDDRTNILRLSDAQLAEVAPVCNQYPDVEIKAQVQDAEDVTASSAVTVVVDLDREFDEDIQFVHAPFYPKPVVEGWWLFVGDFQRNLLLAIKRVTLQSHAQVQLSFNAPAEGKYDYNVYFVCDSFVGCDQEIPIQLTVLPSNSDDEYEDDDDANGQQMADD